jgi:hypothetical protein
MRRVAGPAILTVAVLLSLIAWAAPGAEPAADGRPKLAVIVVFDQMRGDYLERWKDLFVEDGFKRLQRDGIWFTNCHYPYACTITGPGHASILSGCSPDRHGIITNDWYDRASGETVNCVTSERYQNVGSATPESDKAGDQPKNDEGASGSKKAAKKLGGTPDRMLAPTLADTLKAATGGQAKVVGLSLKDRSAILPTGKRPDACYWFDAKSGTFVTSTYYRDRPHDWVAAYNAKRPADRWFGEPWTRLRSDLDYARYSGPDDEPGEGLGINRLQGRVFPHPMTGGLKKPGPAYYETLETSPFGNELLLDFVRQALVAEGLGRHGTPDLLTVSFSSSDLLGHVYGPDSQEVLDATLRADLIVRHLLALLDQHVGKGRYVLALTADHGICPLPEVSRKQGKDADRVRPLAFVAGVTDFFTRTYGSRPDEKGAWIESLSFPWVYLNLRRVQSRGLNPADVADALAGYLRTQPAVQAVYTLKQLEGSIPDDDAIGRRMQKAFNADRCGELGIVTKPYYLLSTTLTGTIHGTPHPYDTHVPLVVYGPGVRPESAGAPSGPCPEAVTPQATAAILAHALGVPAPDKAEAPVPKRLGGP